MNESRKNLVLSIIIILITLIFIVGCALYAVNKKKETVKTVVVDTKVIELEKKVADLSNEQAQVIVEMQGLKGQTNTQTIIQTKDVDVNSIKEQVLNDLRKDPMADCDAVESTDGKLTLYCIKRG
jgi:cell division protein FtsB